MKGADAVVGVMVAVDERCGVVADTIDQSPNIRSVELCWWQMM